MRPGIRRLWYGGLVWPVLAAGLILLLLSAVPAAAGAAEPPSQCVVCHLDAAKLKPLTPADPPPSEAGEG